MGKFFKKLEEKNIERFERSLVNMEIRMRRHRNKYVAVYKRSIRAIGVFTLLVVGIAVSESMERAKDSATAANELYAMQMAEALEVTMEEVTTEEVVVEMVTPKVQPKTQRGVATKKAEPKIEISRNTMLDSVAPSVEVVEETEEEIPTEEPATEEPATEAPKEEIPEEEIPTEEPSTEEPREEEVISVITYEDLNMDVLIPLIIADQSDLGFGMLWDELVEECMAQANGNMPEFIRLVSMSVPSYPNALVDHFGVSILK